MCKRGSDGFPPNNTPHPQVPLIVSFPSNAATRDYFNTDGKWLSLMTKRIIKKDGLPKICPVSFYFISLNVWICPSTTPRCTSRIRSTCSPFSLPASRRSNIHRNPNSSRIPALTSRVCTFGAAGFRWGLQGSFTWVRGIGLHVWLLIVMVRIWENAVLLYCSAGHHFRACSWMLRLRLRLNPPFPFFYAA